MDVLFPFAAYWPFYAGFMAFVLVLLTEIKRLFAPDQKVDPDKNPLIRLFRRMMPITPQSVIAS